MFTIYIPQWHPQTVNKLLEAHFGKRMRLKKMDAQMIGVYSRHVAKAHKKRKVEIIVSVSGPGRRPDEDAFYKSVHDALVQNKLLVDDSRDWCETIPTKVVNGTMSTRINLYDAD